MRALNCRRTLLSNINTYNHLPMEANSLGYLVNLKVIKRVLNLSVGYQIGTTLQKSVANEKVSIAKYGAFRTK